MILTAARVKHLRALASADAAEEEPLQMSVIKAVIIIPPVGFDPSLATAPISPLKDLAQAGAPSPFVLHGEKEMHPTF